MRFSAKLRREIAAAASLLTIIWLLFGLTLIWRESRAYPSPFEESLVLIYRLAHFLSIPAAAINAYLPFEAPLRIAIGSGLAAALVAAFVLWRLRADWRVAQPAGGSEGFTRRQFLWRGAESGALLGIGGLGLYAVWREPGALQVREYSIPIADLPPALDGLRLVHISDTHYGPFMPLPFLKRVVDKANSLKPDLMLLTGDYVHQTPDAIPAGVELLSGLHSKFGTLAVLGNHDHWEGTAEIKLAFAQNKIRLIDNARVFLTAAGLSDASPSEDALCIAGLGDLWEDKQDFEAALGGLPDGMPRLMLSHNPDTAEEMRRPWRIDLMLSGHTHGGQVKLPFLGTPILPSKYGQKYAGGIVEAPHCSVLVSRGVGMAIIPVRFGVPPEIGHVKLVRA